MKTKLLTLALLLIGLSAGAQEPISVSISEDCSQNGHYYYNGYEYVDLGLSVKWATMNVGATNPEDYGYYFAWGETAEKKDYSWSTYKYCNGTSTTMTKYCKSSSFGTVDNKTTLEAEDDAAHVKWGGTWRMPTDAEWTELREQCTWEWTTQNGFNGYLVTSKKNSNSIFLPASGYRYGTGLDNVGSYGFYWSSSLNEYYSDYAYYVYFNSNNVGREYSDRLSGQSVRPVCQNVSATDYYTLTLYAEGCDAPNIVICDAGQQLSVSATPMEHRHFVKWNDGNTDNPRLVTLNQNLTYTAIFADDHEGKCGDNLSWKYADNTLTITGTGEMYDYTFSSIPWLLLRDSITKVIVPDACTSIGSYAFQGCSSLTSITIPASVTSIGEEAFYGCSGLTSIVVESGNPTYDSRNNCNAIIETATNTLIAGCKNTIIPNSVTSIGNDAFSGCSSLTSITIPNSVTSIGDWAFSGCSKIKDLIIPKSLEAMGDGALYNCSGLRSITCYAVTPPSAAGSTFEGVSQYTKTYVLASSLEDYQFAIGWCSLNLLPIGGTETPITKDDVTVTPSTDNATFTWPANDKAEAYSLEITKDGVVFCTLKFNAQGQLVGIAFAPGRNGNHHAPSAIMTTNGWQFTVTGLNAASHYNYTLDVTDAGKQVIKSYKGEFATDGYTDLLTLPYEGNASRVTKFIQNGQMYILRDGKTYTVQGVEIE